MINIRLNILAIFIAALLMCAPLMADDGLNRAITAKILACYDLDTTGVEIEFRKNNIEAAFDSYDSLYVKPMTDAEPRGLVPFQVALFKGGELVSRKQISTRISRFEYALVTTDRIRRQDILTPEKYTLKRVETTYLTEKALTSPEELAGSWARKNIGKDQIITSGLIERIPTIMSGKQISILFKTESMEISAAGIAMETGYVGDLIRVRNSQSRKVIPCTIIDRNTVQVSTH